MWFIFPQLKGLGRSVNADRYGIKGLTEAREYLADPILGPRLIRISEALLIHSNMSPDAIMGGSVDAMKLRSSATLFEAASGKQGPFTDILECFFGGMRCLKTMEMLGA